MNKLDFKKKKAFKRQNSMLPKLEDFGDMEDNDEIGQENAKMRWSVEMNRKKTNRDIGDCMLSKMPRDLLASETAGSVYVPKKKTKGSKRPRASSQVDNDDATVRADSVMSMDESVVGSA
jgi:hypothetical protein